MISIPYQFGINRRLVLPQVIPNWYVFPYQYTYQYHIPKLFLISQGARSERDLMLISYSTRQVTLHL
jgi:hypothetical protein